MTNVTVLKKHQPGVIAGFLELFKSSWTGRGFIALVLIELGANLGISCPNCKKVSRVEEYEEDEEDPRNVRCPHCGQIHPHISGGLD